MRPLKGVITDTSGARLVVRLKSRALIRIPEQKKLRLGDTCYILYNYTIMQVRMVWTDDEYNEMEDLGEEPDTNFPPDWEPPHKWAVEPEGRLVVSL